MPFHDINEDVLTMIAEALYKVGEKQDLASFSIALGKTSTAAVRWLYRDVELDFSAVEAPRTSAILNVLLRKPEYGPFVHKLTVIMEPALFSVDGRLQSRYSDYILWLLPLLPGLQSFSWNSWEPISNPLMDIVRSSKNLKHFHVQLLHGKSRALPIFPDLQHRSGEVEQTVSICGIQNLQGMQFPQHIIQRLKGDDPSVLSIPKAPYDELITTSYQPPLYQKMWLEGYDWSSGKRSTCMFERMFAKLDFLETKSCKNTDAMIKATMKGHDFTRLKTFKVVNSFGSGAYHKEDFSKFLASFDGLEDLSLGDRGLGLYTTDTISAHTDSLETLELHDQLYEDDLFQELGGSGWFSEWQSSGRVQRLSGILRNYSQLRSLHIDMLATEIQHQSSPVVEALRSFGQLSHLTISIPYIVCPTSANQHYSSRPVFTLQDAIKVAELLFSPSLQELDLLSWTRHNPRQFPPWSTEAEEERKMHYSITRSGQGGNIVDRLALTNTPEEKILQRLAESLGELYWPPAEPGCRYLRLKWKRDLYRNVRKRHVIYEEGKGFRTKGVIRYKVVQLPDDYRVARQTGGD